MQAAHRDRAPVHAHARPAGVNGCNGVWITGRGGGDSAGRGAHARPTGVDGEGEGVNGRGPCPAPTPGRKM